MTSYGNASTRRSRRGIAVTAALLVLATVAAVVVDRGGAPAGAADAPTTVFGANDGSGYDDSQGFNQKVSTELHRLGLRAARMGMDGTGCEWVGEACSLAARDVAVDEHLARDVAVHAVVSFRAHVSDEGGEDAWVANFGWKCGQLAEHYRGKVGYYIVDNEPDLANVSPALLVRMQRACYEAVKKADAAIRVECSPASSPGTDYNRQTLAAGIADHCDVIGTHLYGGQLSRDDLAILRGFMAEFGVDKPIGISESGVDPNWYTAGGETYQGLTGREARARWLRDMAAYAVRNKVDNVLFFSMFSIHGEWEMDQDPLALDALDEIGHGQVA